MSQKIVKHRSLYDASLYNTLYALLNLEDYVGAVLQCVKQHRYQHVYHQHHDHYAEMAWDGILNH